MNDTTAVMRLREARKKYDKCSYLMILPAYLIFTIFILIPIVIVIYYSITNFNLYSKPDIVGLKNYLNLFQDNDFLIAIKNTMVYTLATLFPQLALGLLLALMLYRKSILIPIFRTAFYLPNVMSMVCMSMVWLWIYDPTFGLFNVILKSLGYSAKQWLQDPDMAMFCVVLMSIWKSCGYSMVIFLSGLTSIPESLYEAASLDGSNAVRKFLYITWPMLRPTTFFLLVTGIVNSFSVFEQINIMTGGGPLNRTTTIVHQIYRRGFLEFKMGYASAMSVTLLLFSVIITICVFKFGSNGQDVDIS
ncbi:carbohydrate ABC transporter permease [Anaerocolumna sp. MB42-C2]|uniref:carbohydrate ABC transporter permease n=1 Tax=Anaerocolumna sp. MB42-C2 TaxID=3070997 RepID=UPI0027E04532|nr:sugar ABC transporter permease [Anaerocolumna sp. MB42-C2]WMJ89772.1 sugar ABC transporter permease [Anaerocolumna sp. MB42-C2]